MAQTHTPFAFVFPGQGSQTVGMGKTLFDNFTSARAVFQEVDDTLSQNLTRLIFNGPVRDLNLTTNTQPALMAVSLATVRVLEAEAGKSLAQIGDFVAGHSLGEYAALAATGAIGLADTARLLRTRGHAMQSAVPVGNGGMAVLIGAEMDQAKSVTRQAAKKTGEVCVVANDNAPGQIVISGSAAAISVAIEVAKQMGLRRVLPLPVSAPFHSPMMEAATAVMVEALNSVVFNYPSLPVVANVVAEAVTEPTHIRDYLVQQVAGQVRWRESIQYLRAQGIVTTIELGAGKVLSGLTKRIDKQMSSMSVETAEQLDVALAALS